MSGVVNRSVAAFLLFLAVAVTLAALVSSSDASARGIVDDAQEIEITENDRGFPKFDVGDGEIAHGGVMTVVNNTDVRDIGPHTISLVPAKLIPRTTDEKRSCFGKGRICRAIADWHGAKGNKPPAEVDVEAGEKGWDTQGDLKQVGDSYFTAEEGEEYDRVVSRPANKSIHFICAVHPGMNGKVKVTEPTG